MSDMTTRQGIPALASGSRWTGATPPRTSAAPAAPGAGRGRRRPGRPCTRRGRTRSHRLISVRQVPPFGVARYIRGGRLRPPPRLDLKDNVLVVVGVARHDGGRLLGERALGAASRAAARSPVAAVRGRRQRRPSAAYRFQYSQPRGGDIGLRLPLQLACSATSVPADSSIVFLHRRFCIRMRRPANQGRSHDGRLHGGLLRGLKPGHTATCVEDLCCRCRRGGTGADVGVDDAGLRRMRVVNVLPQVQVTVVST